MILLLLFVANVACNSNSCIVSHSATITDVYDTHPSCSAVVFEHDFQPWCASLNQFDSTDLQSITESGAFGVVADFTHGKACIEGSTGEFEVFKNVVVDAGAIQRLRCGCRTLHHVRDVNDALRDAAGQRPHLSSLSFYDVVILAGAPESWAFQHFIDGALPKLVSALALMPRAKVFLFEMPKVASIAYQLLTRILDGDHTRIITERVFFASTLVSACRVPCVHETLFAQARQVVLNGAPVVPDAQRDLVIIFDRQAGTARNGGRTLADVQSLKSALEQSCPTCRVEIFDHRKHTSLDELIAYFSHSIFAVGPHGGALYNSLMLAANTTVVEIFPRVLYGTQMSTHITWLMASMFGLQYWRVHTEGVAKDILVDVERIAQILKLKVEQRQ